LASLGPLGIISGFFSFFTASYSFYT
jgi:hypothetical protein